MKLSSFITALINQGLLLMIVCLLCTVSAFSQGDSEHETVEIPEPLLFDLVRVLGDAKGELKVNSLAEFPFKSDADIEWAPEVEYVLFKNFAVELEFSFSYEELEAF